MKRPILIATIGYIIGIIVGLYFKFSIVFFYIPLVAMYLIYYFVVKQYNMTKNKNSFKLFSIKRYLRYIRIYINSKLIIIIIISSVISNTIVLYQNKNYNIIYSELSAKEKINTTGIIISNPTEKQYYKKYKIKVKHKNQFLKFYITITKKIDLEYGDEISFSGIYIKPEIQRNYKGFDYSEYLKQLKIYGTIKCSEVKIIKKSKENNIIKLASKVSNKIIENTNTILNQNEAAIILGLILGDKTDIEDDVQERFQNASMSHILAVSGMHIAYVILGTNLLFSKIFGKRKAYFINILVLIFYMFITNFSPSVTRAGIMGILMLVSKLIYRKNDIYTSISLSILMSLIYNPFLIKNLGLQLSYTRSFRNHFVK